MKDYLIRTGSFIAVSLAFLWLGAHGDDLRWGQLIVALVAAVVLFRALFVPRWPKSELLAAALRPRKGQVIRAEVEGK